MDYGSCFRNEGGDTRYVEPPCGADLLKLEEEEEAETQEWEDLKKNQKAIDEGRREHDPQPPKKPAREQRQ